MAALMDVLKALRPGASFSNRDGTLAGVRWDTPGVTPPTQAEYDAAAAALDNPVPDEVSSGQLLVALDELGWLSAVDAAVSQTDAWSQRLWARASRFPRNDPLVVGIGTAIGKTSAELDACWRLAATK